MRWLAIIGAWLNGLKESTTSGDEFTGESVDTVVEESSIDVSSEQNVEGELAEAIEPVTTEGLGLELDEEQANISSDESMNEELDELAAVQEIEPCVDMVHSEDWTGNINAALDAFKAMKPVDFEESRRLAHQNLVCLSGIPTKESLVLFHRMEMMHAFTLKDKTSFGAHAQAAYWIDPTFSLEQQELVNEGHPIHYWNSFSIEQVLGRSLPLLPPVEGQFLINGEPRTDVPSDLPYIFQHVIDGQVSLTAFVTIEETVPLYPVLNEFKWQVTLEPKHTMITGGLLGASVLSTMIAYRKHQHFWNPATPNADLASLRSGVNTWSTIGILFGAATVGTIGYQAYQEDGLDAP